MIAVNVTQGINPIEVEGETYALTKGEHAFIPSKLAGAMIKRGWAAKIAKPERLGEIEGAEVRDVSRWVKGISGDQINRLKIGKNGLTISFADKMNVTAGKVYTPFYSAVNNDIKESGFSSVRVANIFNTFKKGEKARLWWKEGNNKKMYIKEVAGSLSWCHLLPDKEAAVKMPDLKKIPVAAIKIDIKDIGMVTKINKKKSVADKYGFVAFCYAGKKVTVYAIHEEQYSLEKTITKLNELEAIEGKGEGIAIYQLEEIEKLLKGTKKGIIRIEEDVPLKVSAGIGKESKAVAFLTPVSDADLRAQIAEAAGIAHKKDASGENRASECLALLIKNSYTRGLIEDGLVMDAYSSATPLQKNLIEKWAKEGYTVVDWGTGYTVSKEDKKNKTEKIKEDKKVEEIINETAPLDYKDWTTIKEGVVENSEAPTYKSGVRLEQNKSFFRIIVKGCYPHGYTTEAEAVEKYEWLTGTEIKEVW